MTESLDKWHIRLDLSSAAEPQLSITGRIEFRDGLVTFLRTLEMAKDFLAQAIEAQRAATTKIGAVEDESAVGSADAPEPHSETD